MKTLDQITPASCDELSALSQQQTNGGIDNVSLAKIPITFPFPTWPISGPIKLPPIKIPVPMPLPYDPVMDY